MGSLGSVLVQAANSTAETEHLLGLADASPVVAGVVGWVDLRSPGVEDELARLAAAPGGRSLVGARHLVHDEPDPDWLAAPEVLRGLRAVAQAGLVFDLLVRPRELSAALKAVDAVPEGRFVLDHGAKPVMEASVDEAWSRPVEELGKRPHVSCKLSGLVTEAGPAWSRELFLPYFDCLLASFGPDRLLFGSDWPVCTTVASYEDVLDLAAFLLDGALSPPDKTRIMGANAARVYGLGPVGA